MEKKNEVHINILFWDNQKGKQSDSLKTFCFIPEKFTDDFKRAIYAVIEKYK